MTFNNKNLYYVGGVVRDELLGVESLDVDYCYEGNAIEFAKDLNVVKTNADFGTVRVLAENGEIDIASTRSETYPKQGHLPLVENIGCGLKEDLKRRDFTINALAKNTLTGEVIDYFNGIEDIKNKTLRVLHSESFKDDPSRIVRGLKFAVRFGFELESETLKLQEEYLQNINYDMSYHRLKKELKETFNLNREEAYERFVNQGIYKLLGKNQELPIKNVSISSLVNQFEPQNVWLVYLGQFDLSNFELTNQEANIVNSYNKIKEIKPENRLQVYKLFKDIPLESVLLYALSVDYKIAYEFLNELKNVKLEMSGKDLLELGFAQSSFYKEIMDFVLAKKLENPEMSKEQELEIVKTKFVC